MSQPFKLFRLQQLDSQIDQTRARLSEVERTLRDDKELQAAVMEESRATERMQEARKVLRRAEEDVQAQKIKIELSEAALYGGKVRNPKELQDLQNEVASLNRYLAVLEDRQLEKMMALEEAENEYTSLAQIHEQIQKKVEVQNAGLSQEKNQLQKDLERLLEERKAAISTVEAVDLNLYENLRQQRKGIAVAKVSDKTCSACGSTLTPSIVQAAHSPTQIARCSFCGRILYAG
jgi:uncharacterized protein